MEQLEPKYDVYLYVGGSKEPILANGLILAAYSRLFANILSLLNFCDGCEERKCVILADEDKDIVEKTVKYLHMKGDKDISDVNVVRDVLTLAKRLQFDDALVLKLEENITKHVTVDDDKNEEDVTELMPLRTALLQIAKEKHSCPAKSVPKLSKAKEKQIQIVEREESLEKTSQGESDQRIRGKVRLARFPFNLC